MRIKRTKLTSGPLSTSFASVPALLIWLALAAAASVFSEFLLAGFFLFVFAVCLLARGWSRSAMKNLTIEVTGRTAHLMEGQEADLTYVLKNDKMLPVFWLELIQALPRRPCLLPDDDDFEHTFLSGREAEGMPSDQAVKKRFSFLLWHETAEWTSRWYAVHRGVYGLNEVILRSGDGFGLTQLECRHPVADHPVFVVYPKIQPVRTQLFLRNLWEGSGGKSGFLESTSTLRSIREYQQNDSWKRINWRQTARQDEVMVNEFDKVRPKSAHFLLDGQAFAGPADGEDALEDCLSVLGSLFLRLDEEGVDCGLSLPKDECGRTFHHPPDEEADISLLMMAVSGYYPRPEKEAPADSDGQSVEWDKLPPMPSRFDEDEVIRSAPAAGRSYLLTYSLDRMRCQALLKRLDASAVTLIPFVSPGEEALALYADYSVVPLSKLKQGGSGHGK